MRNNPELCTPTNILKLTSKLALEAFFGENVLIQSTVTGKVGFPLDEQKLEALQTVLRTTVYPQMTIENFREYVWPKLQRSCCCTM